MKSKLFKILLIFLTFILTVKAYGDNDFNFDVKEIEVTNNGNKFRGLKRGVITTNEGITINANEFEYDKILNILKAIGDVEIKDDRNNNIIFTKKLTYLKTKDTIVTEGSTRALSLTNNIEIYF